VSPSRHDNQELAVASQSNPGASPAGEPPDPLVLGVPTPVYELGREQHRAMLLAGTVALPSPYPAAGRILLTITPWPSGGDQAQFFLKIVESLRDRRIVTRFVRPESLRAVRLCPRSRRGRYRPLDAWPLLTAEDLRERLNQAKQKLLAAARKDGRILPYQIPLFPVPPRGGKDDAGLGDKGGTARYERLGIVYVPEDASVLVRVEEVTAAAEAAEASQVAKLAGLNGPIHCCSVDPTLHEI
jgi:hypothetical protein